MDDQLNAISKANSAKQNHQIKKSSDQEKEKSTSTTLERSLASINGTAENQITSEQTKPSKKKTKKRSKKASSNFMDDEDGDEWMPVTSKKEKLQKSNEQRPPSITNVLLEVTNPSDKSNNKKRRKRNDKPKPEVEPSIIKASIMIPQVSCSPLPASRDPEPSDSLNTIIHPTVRTQRTKQSRRKSDSIRTDKEDAPTAVGVARKEDYASELEYLVAETLGSEAIVNARTHFPSLTFHKPPPTPSDSKLTGLSSDFVQMTAHLRAKEAECQVLRDEVIKMHTDIISLKTTAITQQNISISTAKQSEQKKSVHSAKKVTPTCCKLVQCDPVQTVAPTPLETTFQISTPATNIPSPAYSSASDIVIQTLQSEIANLAKDKILIMQRNQNVETQLKMKERQLKFFQKDAKRTAADAEREAEKAFTERVKQLETELAGVQAELVDKSALLAAQTAKMELVEQTSQNNSQELHRVMCEYEILLDSNNALKQEMSVCTQQINDFQIRFAESADLLGAAENEKEALRQNEITTSSQLTETIDQLAHVERILQEANQSASELNQRISQLQVEAESNQRLTAQLKKNLAASQAETQLANQRVADLQLSQQSSQAELKAKDCQLVEIQIALEAAKTRASDAETKGGEAKVAEIGIPTAQSVEDPITNSSAKINSLASAIEQKTDSDSCSTCAELIVEVDHYKQILDTTEIALSKLQHSVDREEERWQQAIQECIQENVTLKAQMSRLIDEVSVVTSELDQAKQNSEKFHSAAKIPLGNSLKSTVLENGNSKENCQSLSENGEEVEEAATLNGVHTINGTA